MSVDFRFYDKWDFPNCLGCIDGKHVTVQKPDNTGSEFFNYKQRTSIVLMAVCDADYKFTIIDVGQSGSNNDAGIWGHSKLCIGLEQGN